VPLLLLRVKDEIKQAFFLAGSVRQGQRARMQPLPLALKNWEGGGTQPLKEAKGDEEMTGSWGLSKQATQPVQDIYNH
jgi:hypothetical protein